MVCNKSNIGSVKSIVKNGGILENEFIDEDGKTYQRYWISLKGTVNNSPSKAIKSNGLTLFEVRPLLFTSPTEFRQYPH